MDVCLLWVLCVVRSTSLRRTDHSSRGVLSTVARRCMWSRNLDNEEAKAPYRAVRIEPQWVVTPRKQTNKHLRPTSGGTTYVYNNGYLLFFLDDCLLSCFDCSNPNRTKDSHLKTIISANCCIHMVVPPDDGRRYARKLYRLTKCTKNKLCIKLVFLCTIISRSTVNKT